MVFHPFKRRVRFSAAVIFLICAVVPIGFQKTKPLLGATPPDNES